MSDAKSGYYEPGSANRQLDFELVTTGEGPVLRQRVAVPSIEPSLVTVEHDAKTFVYTDGRLTAVQYRVGGLAGTIVATKNFTYDLAGVLTGVSA